MSGMARWADDSSDEDDDYHFTKLNNKKSTNAWAISTNNNKRNENKNAWAKPINSNTKNSNKDNAIYSSSHDSNKSTTVQEVEDWIKQRQIKAAEAEKAKLTPIKSTPTKSPKLPTRESTQERQEEQGVSYNDVKNETADTWLDDDGNSASEDGTEEEASYARSTFSSRQRIDEDNTPPTPRQLRSKISPMSPSPSNNCSTPKKTNASSLSAAASTPSSYSKPTSSSLARSQNENTRDTYVSKYFKGDAPKKRTTSKSLASPTVANASSTPNRRYHFVVADNTPSKDKASSNDKQNRERLDTIVSKDESSKDHQDSPKITAAGEDTSQSNSLKPMQKLLPPSKDSPTKRQQQQPRDNKREQYDKLPQDSKERNEDIINYARSSQLKTNSSSLARQNTIPSSGSSLARAKQSVPSSESSLARARQQNTPSSRSSLVRAKQQIPSSGSSLARASARNTRYNNLLPPQDDNLSFTNSYYSKQKREEEASYNRYVEENASYNQNSYKQNSHANSKNSRRSNKDISHLYPPNPNHPGEMTISYNLARPSVVDIEDEELSFSSSKFSYTSRDYGLHHDRHNPNQHNQKQHGNPNQYHRSSSSNYPSKTKNPNNYYRSNSDNFNNTRNNSRSGYYANVNNNDDDRNRGYQRNTKSSYNRSNSGGRGRGRGGRNNNGRGRGRNNRVNSGATSRFRLVVE